MRPDDVLRLWESTQGERLADRWRETFLNDPRTARLGTFADDLLQESAQAALQASDDGRLKLDRWLTATHHAFHARVGKQGGGGPRPKPAPKKTSGSGRTDSGRGPSVYTGRGR